MKHLLILLSVLLLASCHNKAEEMVSTIDSKLQTEVSSILENKLKEYDAQMGQVIVMESQTGRIKALVGIERKDSAQWQETDEFCKPQPTGLFTTMSMLAVLESGKVRLGDTVDTGNGMLTIDGDVIKDHNWHRGGYGKISMLQGFASSSNVALVSCLQKAFPNKDDFYKQLEKMSVHQPENIKGIKQDTLKDYTCGDYKYDALGYDECSPIQIVVFFNAIANGGRMVLPTLYEDSVTVINPQIASKANIDSIGKALRYVVTDGLGNKATSNKAEVAGKNGAIPIGGNSYNVDFCGYFPVDSLQYTVIVSLQKEGLPASGGGMAAPIFKEIAEYILGSNH